MRKILVLHPFLFAAFPILALYANNMGELSFSETLVPLAVALGSASLLLLLSWLVFRDIRRAGLIVSVFLMLFFISGYVRYYVLNTLNLPGVANWLLPTFFLGILGAGLYLSARARLNLRNWTTILNVTAVALVLVSSINLGVYEIRRHDSNPAHGTPAMPLELDKPDVPPDIYYIILDGYARADYLMEAHDYDNGAFTDYLSDRGFLVASDSRSNYAVTHLSLASSLNMEYIQVLVSQATLASQDLKSLAKLVENNRVANILKSVGYQYISFNTWCDPTRHSSQADLSIDVSGKSLTPFQRTLVETSLAGLVWHDTSYYGEHVIRSFDKLAEMPSIEGPKFVFAHIICPHWPFVFDADGRRIEPVDWRHDTDRVKKWLDQITFVNKKLEIMVDEILESSAAPPIIILQGDHGPRGDIVGYRGDRYDPTEATVQDAMEILNAYYLPERGKAALYESISPINTFRVILNLYFGAHLELLSDESYYSDSWDRPLSLVNVTDKL